MSQSTPPATPSPAPGGGGGAPATRIDNEKTDPGDLAFHDVFPAETLRLGGRTFTRDRWSLNRDVAYAARGSMLATLKRERCRKIVRATYIDPRSKLAVTSGIAVMPTKAAALTVSKAGDPAKYEWFRGMAGKRSPDIDRAGGTRRRPSAAGTSPTPTCSGRTAGRPSPATRRSRRSRSSSSTTTCARSCNAPGAERRGRPGQPPCLGAAPPDGAGCSAAAAAAVAFSVRTRRVSWARRARLSSSG